MMNFMRFIVLCALLALLLCGCQSDIPTGTTTAPTTNETTTSTGIVIPTKPSTNPVDDGKETYTVTVLDQNGDPVENVVLQFCDDHNCKMPVATDATGTVSVSYAESEYHVTLNELPTGYTSEETVFYFDGSYELTITVTAKS